MANVPTLWPEPMGPFIGPAPLHPIQSNPWGQAGGLRADKKRIKLFCHTNGLEPGCSVGYLYGLILRIAQAIRMGPYDYLLAKPLRC